MESHSTPAEPSRGQGLTGNPQADSGSAPLLGSFSGRASQPPVSETPLFMSSPGCSARAVQCTHTWQLCSNYFTHTVTLLHLQMLPQNDFPYTGNLRALKWGLILWHSHNTPIPWGEGPVWLGLGEGSGPKWKAQSHSSSIQQLSLTHGASANTSATP